MKVLDPGTSRVRAFTGCYQVYCDRSIWTHNERIFVCKLSALLASGDQQFWRKCLTRATVFFLRVVVFGDIWLSGTRVAHS